MDTCSVCGFPIAHGVGGYAGNLCQCHWRQRLVASKDSTLMAQLVELQEENARLREESRNRPFVAAPADVSAETNDKLRGLMQRLGMGTEESLETFGFSLEDNLLRTISAVHRLLDRVAAPAG